jgi:hypothetical protein
MQSIPDTFGEQHDHIISLLTLRINFLPMPSIKVQVNYFLGMLKPENATARWHKPNA